MEPTNDSERALARAYPLGQQVDLVGEPAERTIRAAFLAALLSNRVATPTDAPYASLRLTGARVSGTLDLRDATIAASIWMKDCTFDEELRLEDADLRSLRLPGCRVPGFRAGNLRVHGNLELGDGFTSTRRVELIGARIGGDLRLVRAVLRHTPEPEDDGDPKYVALLGSRMRIEGAFFGRHLEAHGQVRLISTRVEGLFSLKGAHLSNPGRVALSCERMEVGESVFFQKGFVAEGRVIMMNCAVEGGVDGVDSTFGGAPEGRACLDLRRLKVGRNLVFQRATISGDVAMQYASITGNISFSSARFGADDRVLARRASAALVNLRTEAPPKEIDLRYLRTDIIEDAEPSWPQRLRLAGLTYLALEPVKPVDVKRRLEWLRLDDRAYVPQPYDQLVAAYRAMGEEQHASTVALAKLRRRTTSLPWPGRLVGLVQDAFVGYGYQTWRALLWLAVSLLVGTLVFREQPPTPSDGAPAFNAGAYAADVLLPIVDLGQADHFTTQGTARWVMWGLIVIGWALTTAVVAGLTRVLARP